jgi:acyl-CoA thioester hydrolase
VDLLTPQGHVSSQTTDHRPPFTLERDLMVTAFKHPIRIYWEDTDAGGIVYYANYLKFMERARTEWLRALGVEQESLQSEHGLMFVVVHADVSFRKPARYGDSLQVSCTLAERSRASMTFSQQVVRESTDELLVEGFIRIACLDALKLKPRGLPAIVVQQIGVVQKIGVVAKIGGGVS